jgi:tetratricopeptide (TPR) repeat protein
MSRLFFIACLLPFLCHSLGGQAPVEKKPPPNAAGESAFALDAAKKYEGLGEWEKAEEQYLKAGASAMPDLRQRSLDGAIRMREDLREQKKHAALVSAKLLEDQERWKDAEQAYLDILKSDPQAEREATAALHRIRPHIPGPRWSEAFDEYAATIGRVLLVPAFLLVLLALWFSVLAVSKTRRSIQLIPFTGSTDDSTKQIAFWMQRVRGELRSAALPLFSASGESPRSMPPNVESGFPFTGEIELQLETPEPPELEIGGIKLPLKQILQFVAVPRVRVSGCWFIGQATGNAYAEVERRGWTKFEQHSIVRRAIVSTPGAAQDKDLRIFAYDVLMRASRAYEQ